jgi:hypothetical protein
MTLGFAVRLHRASLRLRLLCVAVMMFVLLCAQTVGLMHRSVHSPHAQQGYGVQDVLTAGLIKAGMHGHDDHMLAAHGKDTHDNDIHDHSGHNAAHQYADHDYEHLSWIAQLFAHQDGDKTCRLVDAQASCDMAFAALGTVLPAQAAIISIAFSQILSTARAAALFDARGPPATL